MKAESISHHISVVWCSQKLDELVHMEVAVSVIKHE
jgi:hypothetical protein